MDRLILIAVLLLRQERGLFRHRHAHDSRIRRLEQPRGRREVIRRLFHILRYGHNHLPPGAPRIADA